MSDRAPLAESLGTFLDRSRGASNHAAELHVQLRRAARLVQGAPEVVVKVYGGAGTCGGSAEHLDYLMQREDEEGREFDLPAENQDGRVLDHAAARAELADWRLTHTTAAAARQDGRRTLHLVLSMPADTDPQALQAAVRAWSADVFGKDGEPNHAHLIVFHDRHSRRDHHEGGTHPHAHIIVDRAGRDLTMLDNGPEALHDWRVRFAEALEDEGVRASATPWAARHPSRHPHRRHAVEAAARELEATQDAAGRALAAGLRRHGQAMRPVEAQQPARRPPARGQ